MNLIEDVDLATPRRAQCGPTHEIAHGVDPVVRRRVHFDDVHRRTGGHLKARVTRATRFAILQIGAIEGLGENACRCRFPAPTRAAEQIGVGHSVCADGIAERV